MFCKIFILCVFCFICYGEDIFIRLEGAVYRAGNTHAFDPVKIKDHNKKLLVSKERDIFLEPVKKSVKFAFSSKNPSNLSVGQYIKLKNDGKQTPDKIKSFDKYFIQTDMEIRRGDSGRIAVDNNDVPIGLVSYYKKQQTFIVRIDNLEISEFEEITVADLYRDRQIFSAQKEYEYLLFDFLRKSSSCDEMKKFLKRELRPAAKYDAWRSVYLKKRYIESANNVNRLLSGLSDGKKLFGF